MEQTRLRILFLANVPSPYRVEFFNVLGRECDLTVLYQLHSSAERDKKWTAQADTCYAQVYLKGRATSVDKALCPGVIPWLQKDWDAIVISGNTSPTELLAIAWCKLRGIPYCLEADGAFPGSGRGLKELIAPVEQGQTIGKLCLYSGEELLLELPLVAAEEIPRLTLGEIYVRVLKRAAMAKT